MEDFTGDFDFAFEIDKLFEENDDIFGANDLLFNKETKQSPTTVQEDTGPSSNSGHFAELENEDLDSILTDAESKNTKQQTKWAMTVFKGWYEPLILSLMWVHFLHFHLSFI